MKSLYLIAIGLGLVAVCVDAAPPTHEENEHRDRGGPPHVVRRDEEIGDDVEVAGLGFGLGRKKDGLIGFDGVDGRKKGGLRRVDGVDGQKKGLGLRRFGVDGQKKGLRRVDGVDGQKKGLGRDGFVDGGLVDGGLVDGKKKGGRLRRFGKKGPIADGKKKGGRLGRFGRKGRFVDGGKKKDGLFGVDGRKKDGLGLGLRRKKLIRRDEIDDTDVEVAANVEDMQDDDDAVEVAGGKKGFGRGFKKNIGVTTKTGFGIKKDGFRPAFGKKKIIRRDEGDDYENEGKTKALKV
ncbi:hypothetical protein HK104_007562 [Borealophlyctis nickersoniae]|nr:hypothetical protein HK104_007562 [Borealophlyctis nickersoniae]